MTRWKTLRAHLCHVPGCPRGVPAAMLMCRDHWFTVPLALRRQVWATYRPGQGIDKEPSPEWMAAANDAIQSVQKGHHV